jgi:secreted PhoX family phosphatase
VAHEGLAFDKSNAMYFVDELNGGSIYKYVSQTPANGSTYFSAGQTFVLKVGAGSNYEVTGGATWVPITDMAGNALSGIPTIVVDGMTVVDGRAAADTVFGTGFNTNRTYSVNLVDSGTANVAIFVDQNTINAFDSVAVGGQFFNPDNLAIDAAGNIYIVEDQPAGVADIWMAWDADRDGIAESIGRWASMTTAGAEPTGLYFDPFNPNRAWINVQHAGSDIDRTIEINAVPEPATLALGVAGLGLIGGLRRRRRS